MCSSLFMKKIQEDSFSRHGCICTNTSLGSDNENDHFNQHIQRFPWTLGHFCSSDFSSTGACFHLCIKKHNCDFLFPLTIVFCYRNKRTNCDCNWNCILRTVRGTVAIPFIFFFCGGNKLNSVQIHECDTL